MVAKKLMARERVVWTSMDKKLVGTEGRITYDWAHRTVDYLKQSDHHVNPLLSSCKLAAPNLPQAMEQTQCSDLYSL